MLIAAYCLMSNHFHFLVKIRSVKEQQQIFGYYREKLKLNKEQWLPHGCNHDNFKQQSASRQFSHLFSKYTKNFNGWYQRTGKLFEQPFKRKQVKDTYYLGYLVCYIHRNPIHHGISSNFQTYPHSSYNAFLLDSKTLLDKEKVLNWFGGKKQFIMAHEEINNKIASNLKIE